MEIDPMIAVIFFLDLRGIWQSLWRRMIFGDTWNIRGIE